MAFSGRPRGSKTGHVATSSVVALPRCTHGGAAFRVGANDAQPFRVLLLRRLWLQLPSSVRDCRCGLPLGFSCAACATAGVLGRRGFALESAAARVCREAGASVSLSGRVQDKDLARPIALDNRLLGIVADGLPLFRRQAQVFLAKAKARREPARVPELPKLGVSGGPSCWGKAVALFLLERPGGLGSDGAAPTTSDVIGEARYAGFLI